jgi:hypothetical protein
LARLATPAVLVAAGLSLGPAQGPATRSTRIVADAHTLAGPRIMQPFAATPRVYRFQVRTVGVSHPAPTTPAPAVALPPSRTVAASAIPSQVLGAYINAVQMTDAADPHCKLDWQTLAGIGFVESDNARAGGSTNPGWNGIANPPILGPHGGLGPMQIRPATWAVFRADGNHDGVRDPQDIDDASVAAADILCAAEPGLNRPAHLIKALYAYDHSNHYVRAVLRAIARYLNVEPSTLGIDRVQRHQRPLPTFHIILPAAPATSASPPTMPSRTEPWVPPPTPTTPPKLPLLPKR